MPEPVTRDYKIADEVMIQDARTKHAAFTEDKADFIAFDADFTDPYGDDFETAINDAEATDDDETITDQITQLTNDVLEEERLCREKFQDSKFFIEKAFPDNVAVQNEFGFNDYKTAHRTTAAFIKFMLKFHKIATKYSVQLAAENYNAAKIAEILTRYTALRDADIEQELFIKNRPVKTAERITKMNAAWKIEGAICNAGKRIYNDNYSKYQRYLLPPGEEAAEAISIQGTVTNSAGGAAEEGVEVRIDALDISVFTNAAGLYNIGGLPAGTYELIFRKDTLQEKVIDAVVVVDGEVTTLDVVMDPV